jgi:N-acetylglucosaminyldiphosphoundecaprenol N-acetyl-beta-D-mannosaminyltransferase
MFSEKILNIRIDSLNVEEALSQVKSFFDQNEKKFIFTPNPEMLVKAQQDELFTEILNRGDIKLCDGFGLKLIGYLRGRIFNRITGIDFLYELCNWCKNEYKSVYLLGGKEKEVVEKTREVLREKYPGLKIVGCHSGIDIKDNGNNGLEYDQQKNQLIIEEINDVRPDVIFVAFGMGKQEKWLVENLPKITKVKIGVGVGGAFDFVSGRIPRAPLLMRKFGLEWAYRFYREPVRFKRIFNATIKFLYLALKEKKV